MADRSIRVHLLAITSQYQAAMAKATASTRAFATQAMASAKTSTQAQSAMSALGVNAKLMMGGAVAGGLLYAAKAAIDFESSFAGVRKTVKGSEEDFAALSGGLRELATEIPINVNELNDIAAAAGQLGIQTPSILGFTETMAKLGVTTNLSSEQGATQLARVRQHHSDVSGKLRAARLDGCLAR